MVPVPVDEVRICWSEILVLLCARALRTKLQRTVALMPAMSRTESSYRGILQYVRVGVCVSCGSRSWQMSVIFQLNLSGGVRKNL